MELTSARALAQYIGICCRPDVCVAVQLLEPGKEPTTSQEKKDFSKAISRLQDTGDVGQNYKNLDLSSVKIFVISDAAFGNSRVFKSQLGYVILLQDKHGTANIVHNCSNRCKGATRSVLATEPHALVLAFDQAYGLRELTTEILEKNLLIEAVIDSKTLFDVVVKDRSPTEKRLQIDIFAVKQS